MECVPKSAKYLMQEVKNVLDLRACPTAAPCIGSQLDFEGFRRRLRSFAGLRGANVSCLNPVHAAAYGWEMTSGGALQCETCREIFQIQMPDVASDPALYSATEQKVTEQIERVAHKSCCPWASCPCPPSFRRVSLESTSRFASERSVRNMLAYSKTKDLPRVSASCKNLLLASIPDPWLSENNYREFCAIFNNAGVGDETVVENPVCLTVAGWRLTDGDAHISHLSCDFCFRKIPLPVMLGEGGHRAFHALEEHRHWCPWVAGASFSQAELASCASDKAVTPSARECDTVGFVTAVMQAFSARCRKRLRAREMLD